MESNGVSQEAAAVEILKRRSGRQSLIGFTEYTKSDFKTNWHHKKIAGALESVERGECDRLIIFAPPRHTKSELASRRFPAWYLGRHPDKQLICSTYSGDFALDFGRDVRGIVSSEEYAKLFPDVKMSADSRAANRWQTNRGGVSVYVGVGGPITGRGADIAIIDDPFKNREEADSEARRESVWRWYTSTLRTRLMPGGAIILVLCMTGDTPVMLLDGSEKRLDAIRVGDKVATYENGRLSTSTVRNWRSNGRDFIFKITMSSGRIVRANGRHPFLVSDNGELKWIQTRSLTTANRIVTVRDSVGSGQGRSVLLKNVSNLRYVGDIATNTIIRKNGQMGVAHLPLVRTLIGLGRLSITTVLQLKNTISSFLRKMVNVLSAALRSLQGHGPETTDSALTTAMKRAWFVDFSVMPAIYQSGMSVANLWQPHSLNTSEFTLDRVTSVEADGEDEVFDIQVDRTENFIANGLVSHNTHWHDDDLAGRLLNRSPDEWTLVELQAISGEGTPNEEALWPEWYPLEALKRIKADVGPREWSALYQQRPQPDDGTYFIREWFRWYSDRPSNLNIYISSDYAVTEGGGDFTEHGVFGINEHGDIYILDWWSGQSTAEVWIDKLLDLVAMYKPMACFGETGPIKRAIEPFLIRRSRERKVYARFEWITRSGNKEAMTRGFQARASMGKVYLPRDKDWAHDLLSQLLRFPATTIDDKVDVCGLIGMALDQTHPATEVAKKKLIVYDRWDRAFNNMVDEDDSWKTV